jgi:hypothetical protein
MPRRMDRAGKFRHINHSARVPPLRPFQRPKPSDQDRRRPRHRLRLFPPCIGLMVDYRRSFRCRPIQRTGRTASDNRDRPCRRRRQLPDRQGDTKRLPPKIATSAHQSVVSGGRQGQRGGVAHSFGVAGAMVACGVNPRQRGAQAVINGLDLQGVPDAEFCMPDSFDEWIEKVCEADPLPVDFDDDDGESVTGPPLATEEIQAARIRHASPKGVPSGLCSGIVFEVATVSFQVTTFWLGSPKDTCCFRIYATTLQS